MAKSILQDTKQCFITQATTNLHKHHIYYGVGLRQISEDNGFWVYLRGDFHNQSNQGVHCGNKTLDLHLKETCQCKYEETHSRDDFMRLIGRNYLD